MYFYSLYGYEELTSLVHDQKYTAKQFKEMCNEVPLVEGYGLKTYDSMAIRNHLIEKHGFKELKYTTGFNIDGKFK